MCTGIECQNHQPHYCIHRVPVFQQLSEVDMRSVQAITLSRAYRKGSYIFRAGECSDSLFVVNEGLVKLYTTSEDGREHVIRFLFPGDFFGQLALLQNKNHYANAEVVDDASVCSIRRDELIPLLERNPAMAFSFLTAVSERLQQADEWAEDLHLYEADRRLAKLLLYFHHKTSAESADLVLPAAKKELAVMIGITPETLSRKLAYLESQGVIHVEKRVIRILEMGQLRETAGILDENKKAPVS